MKYLAYDRDGGPEVLYVGETAAPSPAPGEILLEVEAAGVSHADVLQRRGEYPPPPHISPILGLEAAGRVAALGEGVTQWKAGDRVCALCNGGADAQYVAVPQGQVLPIPENWSAVEAATLCENLFTVYDNLVTRAGLRAGQTLLVHGGTSGIGSTAIMLARSIGARAIATAGNAVKTAACLRAGAARAIDYRTQDFVAEVLRITENRGVDVVLDIVGGEYVNRNLRALAFDGRIVCLATQGGRHADLDLGLVLHKRATVMGSSLRPRTNEQKAAIAAALREHVWPLLPARDPIFPLIDAVYPLERAAEAHARLEASAHIGKIVLTMS